MGELTKSELKVLALIADSINSEIFSIDSDYTAKDRLNFLACLNENEKLKYTKQEIKKMQTGFKECNPDVAEFIFAYIQRHPTETMGYDERINNLINNFILSHFSEELEDLDQNYNKTLLL